VSACAEAKTARLSRYTGDRPPTRSAVDSLVSRADNLFSVADDLVVWSKEDFGELSASATITVSICHHILAIKYWPQHINAG